MKFVIGSVATLAGVLFMCSMASANPALLPKHEGYPMKNDGSPVNGQPTANDPGQKAGAGESTSRLCTITQRAHSTTTSSRWFVAVERT